MPVLTGRPVMPFWRMTAPVGEDENPLKFTCASNYPEPSVSPTDSMITAIAFGFTRCWLEPDDFQHWEKLHSSDIRDLRSAFLDAIETVAINIYRGRYKPDILNFDAAGYETIDIIDYSVDEDDDARQIGYFMWLPNVLNEEGLEVELVYNAMQGEDEDFYKVYIGLDAFRDRARVRAAIDFGRHLLGQEMTGEEWDNIGVQQVFPAFKSAILDTSVGTEAGLQEFTYWCDDCPGLVNEDEKPPLPFEQ